MLQTNNWDRSSLAPFASSTPEPTRSNFGAVYGTIRRHSAGLILWVLACVSATIVYIAITPPEYSAAANIVLEPRRVVTSPQTANAGGPPVALDSPQVESQALVVKSENVLRFAFDERNLKADPEFQPRPSLISRLLAPFASKPTQAPAENRADAAAFSSFEDHVSVRRVGTSFVLEISFRSRSPERAASMANSIAASYIRDQIEATMLMMQANGDLLQGRLDGIKAQMDAATAAVRSGMPPTMKFSASNARIISPATEPLAKSYPQSTLLTLFSLSFALLTGLGAVFIRHGLDHKIRVRGQIGRELGVECLGAIPAIREGRAKFQREALTLATSKAHAFSQFAESFRTVRTGILGSDIIKQSTIIGFVSCFPGEGKSLVASNLAHLFAASGRTTTLIDANLRSPSLTHALAPDAEAGLASVLAFGGENRYAPGIALEPSLYFIAASGHHDVADPNLYLGSSAMESLLVDLQSQDFVFIDLPAVTTSSDVKAIGPMLDAVVLVLEVGRATTEDAYETLEMLRQCNIKVIGAVLNKAPRRDLPSPIAT